MSKKNKNSVFYFSCCKRYYLTHPWKWIKEACQNLKAAWMRATKGWCYSDIWNWDCWFMDTVPDMFRYLAQHGMAYPGREPFDTPEKWHDWLNEMANLIETGKEDWQDEHNEYYQEYMAHLMDKWEPFVKSEDGLWHHKPSPTTELDTKYFNRSKELAEEGDKNIKSALSQIAEHFYQIWD